MPPEFDRFTDRIKLLDDYLIPELVRVFPRIPRIDILFVCEGLSFDTTSGFSFKILIDTLRNDAAVPYANFRVTLARWGSDPAQPLQVVTSPGNYDAKYTNYRFDSRLPGATAPLLDDFDEVWLFGINPNTTEAVARDTIFDSATCPTQEDLVAVTRFMNRGGGVLAMGDHASLGAYLCARVPRVWTMRRWTAEDGAPPIGGEDRVDTNRPMIADQNPALTTSPSMIPFDAQTDEVPQKIDVRRYAVRGRFTRGWRPHPILCGGRLGVIDVLPDHPHEGWIKETADIALAAKVDFSVPAGLEDDEYPMVAGVQPQPEVIAWGNTTADPPHFHFKGDSPHKRFGVIGAYDGHSIALGRVVVDSTWHHWMSVNLSGTYVMDDPAIPGDQPMQGLLEAGGTNFDKIVTYFRNVAVWLAPPRRQQQMLAALSYRAALSVRTFEDWRLDTPILQLGAEGKDVLGRATSDCFVGRWVRDFFPIEIPEHRFDPRDPVCLSCPPDDWLEDIAIGTLIRQMMLLRDRQLENRKQLAELGPEGIEKQLMGAMQLARREATKIVVDRLEHESARLATTVEKLRSVVHDKAL